VHSTYCRLTHSSCSNSQVTLSKPNTLSSEREWNKVFNMLAQIQHKQNHGTSNILTSPQRFSSTIDEDARVEDNSNNHSNNTSFNDSRWDDMFKLLLEFKQKHGHFKIPSDCGNENKKLVRWMYNWRKNYREYKRTNGQKGDPKRMKCLESIGLVDDITTKNANRRVNTSWNVMYNQLLEFKQKHGHVKVPQRHSENPKLGNWVKHWRSNYREYKRTNGQKGDPVLMEHLESIGLVDDIRIRIHHDKMTNCANIKVPTPMIVSSMSPTFSSHTQTITKENPLLVSMKREEKSGDNRGGANHTQADLNFLGSELSGKGGFWV
jgi:hypothetical protein